MTKKRKRPATSHPTRSPRATDSVYGESAAVLMFTFAKANFGTSSDGMATMELTMEADGSKPVLRAAMRAEAALLLEDADSDDPLCRTPDQRRFDAFQDLILQTSLHQFTVLGRRPAFT